MILNRYSILQFFNFSILQFFLHPLAGIDEGLNPRCYLIVAAVSGIPGVLPWEYGTLQVRHHAQMTTVLRADTCHVIVRTVRISGIASIVVLSNYVVSALSLGQ